MTDPEKMQYYLEGVPTPETPQPGETPKPWQETQFVGKPLPRVDTYERVSGTAVYPADVTLPKMVYGAILRCPHPHAQVKQIDTRNARRMPGVCAVIGINTPEADVPWSYRDRGTIRQSRLFDPHCRFEGDAVAAVAAESPYQAWDAVKAISVDYEILPFVADERAAAISVKQQLIAIAAKDLKIAAGDLYLQSGSVMSRIDPSKRIKISQLSGLKDRGVVVGIGYQKYT